MERFAGLVSWRVSIDVKERVLGETKADQVILCAVRENHGLKLARQSQVSVYQACRSHCTRETKKAELIVQTKILLL